jgi:hypothetical protein
VVVEHRLAHDVAGEPFLELLAERDHSEAESLPDHQLEHALDQERDDPNPTAAALMRAELAGLAIELVGPGCAGSSMQSCSKPAASSVRKPLLLLRAAAPG